MKNEIILWLSSLVLAFLLGYFKNVTDKDFPVTGTFGIEGTKVSYKLDKVSYDRISYKNIIISDLDGLTGKFIWKQDGIKRELFYSKSEGGLEVEIPKLKPGKSIKFKIELIYKENSYNIPGEGYITHTFWGHIPGAVNFLNFIILYGGLLIGFRCILEIFNENKNLKKYAFIVCIFFLTLNILIIPLRNSYKLGAINNYIPSILDLIEPALLLILVLWIAGTILLFFNKHIKIVTAVITAATIVLFFFVD